MSPGSVFAVVHATAIEHELCPNGIRHELDVMSPLLVGGVPSGATVTVVHVLQLLPSLDSSIEPELPEDDLSAHARI